MSSEITLDFKKSDIDAFYKGMTRMSKELGYNTKKSTTLAAKKLLGSLQASTKKSPKKRVVKLVSEIPGKKLNKYVAKRKYDKKEPERFFVAHSLENAKQSHHARIGRKGLAKRHWYWAGKDAKLNIPSGGKILARDGEKISRRVSSGTILEDSDRIAYKIESELRYVWDAFKGKGKYTVDTAMERANRAITRDINLKHYRKFAKGVPFLK